MSEFLTPKSRDFSEWYTDVILKAELADYAPVKGCMVIRPYGFAIWEHIRTILDRYFRETGHVNAYFPLFIPYSFLQKESEHVEGFAPEVAVVTHAGGKDLEEPLVVRPTSETIMYAMYAKWIRSYRDLPILINQWANVVRWEMRTRLFLRTTEFLWQEGHTAHATKEEAEHEARLILSIYRRFIEDDLAIPVITGTKSEAEKFAGAEKTYTVEAMMGDRKALQAGTSHHLGQNFARAFDVRYQDQEGQWKYVWQTSWGVSTRLIGALIMVHGDEQGLSLPPRVAPIQVVIVPIWKKNEELAALEPAIEKIGQAYRSLNIRWHVDKREQLTPGFKFNDWELKGVPLRIEIGPRDLTNNQAIMVPRGGKKLSIPLSQVPETSLQFLKEIQQNLLERARTFLAENTHTIDAWEDFLKHMEERGGFYRVHWCGKASCEALFKEQAKASIRCIPLEEDPETGACIICRQKSPRRVIVARAY